MTTLSRVINGLALAREAHHVFDEAADLVANAAYRASLANAFDVIHKVNALLLAKGAPQDMNLLFPSNPMTPSTFTSYDDWRRATPSRLSCRPRLRLSHEDHPGGSAESEAPTA